MGLVLEDVALAQSFHGYMLFALIAIKRSASRDLGIEILNVVLGRSDDAPIWLVHAHKIDLHGLCGRLKREPQKPPVLYASIALNADPADLLAREIAVVVEGNFGRQLLDDGCFLGIRILGWDAR